jgi:hypothetical protein
MELRGVGFGSILRRGSFVYGGNKKQETKEKRNECEWRSRICCI